jgi:hypothetical protein
VAETDGGDELIDFRHGQHGGQLGLPGHAKLAECRPVTRAGARVKEFQSRIGDLQRIGFSLRIVLDVQQVAPEVIFGGSIR